jgi:hypothetical protein
MPRHPIGGCPERRHHHPICQSDAVAYGLSALRNPAVVRKHGRQFLERMWSNMDGHSHPTGFERVIRHFGAEASESGGITLVSFQDGGGLVLPEDLSGNPHVRRGIWDGPDARRRFEERHAVMLLPVCAESDEEPILRASFDGITDDGVPVELKALAEENLREAKANGTQSEMYRRHKPQVQAQIFVSGADKGFLSLKWRNDFVDWEIPRDDAFINQIVEAARAFWECILTAKEPPLDMERDMYVPAGEELDAWLKLAADSRQLDEKLAS